MTPHTRARASFAAIVVRLAGAWVLAGAVAKLLLGTPKDLPEIVRKLTPLGLDPTFHIVIGIELAVVCLGWTKPRLAWPVVLALFGFFEFVLVTQLLAGASSCGCFGATIKVSPWLMLSVDSALLISILLSRPWSAIQSPGLAAPVLVAGWVIAFALPWIVIRGPDPTGKSPSRYVELHTDHWVGKSVFDLAELTRWVPEDQIPTDGKIVLWRQGCEHCAAHLRLMASHEDPSHPIVLLQIRDDLKTSRAVDAMPDGARFALPENLEVVVTTPLEVRVAGGVVTAVLDEEHARKEYE